MSPAIPLILTSFVAFVLYVVFVYAPTRQKMREELHVFLDLETYSTRPNAAILAIGAVCVNLLGEEVGRIKLLIKVKDAALYGHVDAQTVEWWEDQCDDAIRLTFSDDERWSLVNALGLYNVWHDSLGNVSGVWGNGSTFDCSILRSAYTAVGGMVPAGCPWDFWQERDCRTIVDLGRLSGLPDYKNEIHFDGTRHNCVDDAAHQAAYTTAYIRDLI